MNYNQKTGLLIVLSTALRMGVAGFLELGNDEVYYQSYARHLQWNYFDHPPGVALLIRLTTGNLFFHHEFFIRLGPVLLAAAGTWLIFQIGSRIGNPRRGWIAACLYNTSFYSSVIAGIFILPDSAQPFLWLSSVYFMIRILEPDALGQKQLLYFILLGISIGLCTMCKIHGIFLWIGFGGYLIFNRHDLVKSAMPWISLVISLIIIFPIYQWNRANRFLTYNYHQGRIHFWGVKPDMDHLLQQILGSVFYSNPVNFIIYVLAILALTRHKLKSWEFPLFLWLSLPLILLLLWTSLFNETLPHWSGPAYLTMMLLGACWLDQQISNRKIQGWLRVAGWVSVGIIILATLSIRFLPFRIGSSEPKILGKGDIFLDMSGWKSFAVTLDSLYRTDSATGRMKPDAVLISDYWFPAGHLDFYFSTPYNRRLLVIGPLNNIHQFAWLNKEGPRIKPGADAYFIYPTNYYGAPDGSLRRLFTGFVDSLQIPQYRQGTLVRNFVVYRMHDFRGDSSDYLIPGIH